MLLEVKLETVVARCCDTAHWEPVLRLQGRVDLAGVEPHILHRPELLPLWSEREKPPSQAATPSAVTSDRQQPLEEGTIVLQTEA
jgi:hypothetical protein